MFFSYCVDQCDSSGIATPSPSPNINEVQQHLKFIFEYQSIGCSDLIQWHARSPDLPDLLCWSYVNSFVFKTPVESVGDLISLISVAIGSPKHANNFPEC
ncbi:hypothetical protein NPIL_80301 [Nephila pilipes]|uniref:Uncharacterized protein n=1 Tax=Nephila pilipes TaxID=299642 RepID=A0A8X6U4T5_NEPPI|nr:hypothetical protein NPIL_80301 [Nephila pilipes]